MDSGGEEYPPSVIASAFVKEYYTALQDTPLIDFMATAERVRAPSWSSLAHSLKLKWRHHVKVQDNPCSRGISPPDAAPFDMADLPPSPQPPSAHLLLNIFLKRRVSVWHERLCSRAYTPVFDPLF